jgi:TonB family protein
MDDVPVPVSSTVFVNFTLLDTSRPGDQPPGPATIRLGTNVLAAKLLSRIEPVYPLEAQQKRIEGEVLFEVTIDEQGEVIEVQVLGGNAILVAAAYDAVRHWRYTPVLLNGNPVRAKANVSIKFEMNPQSALAESTPAVDVPAAVIDAPQAAWLRRPRSETEHQRRVEYANTRFAPDGISGSKTDRGRVYVEWGPPDQIESHPNGGLGKDYPFEVWAYQRSEEGRPSSMFFVSFLGKEYRLVAPAVPTR